MFRFYILHQRFAVREDFLTCHINGNRTCQKVMNWGIGTGNEETNDLSHEKHYHKNNTYNAYGIEEYHHNDIERNHKFNSKFAKDGSCEQLNIAYFDSFLVH